MVESWKKIRRKEQGGQGGGGGEEEIIACSVNLLPRIQIIIIFRNPSVSYSLI